MKLQNLILIGGLGVVAYMIYNKSKTTPTPTKSSNTLKVDSKPESKPESKELPTSEVEMENKELLSPPKRKIKEQMTDTVLGGDKMCFNAMKF